MRSLALPIFVYGTLQRGEEREPLWPAEPTHIEWATVAGRLFDLGPYPGLVEGNDQVLGELWHIAAAELAATLEILDRVEGYNQPGQPNWYVRTIVECWTEHERAQRAYAYRYAGSENLNGAAVMQPNRQGLVHWHRFCPQIHGPN